MMDPLSRKDIQMADESSDNINCTFFKVKTFQYESYQLMVILDIFNYVTLPLIFYREQTQTR